MTLTGWVRGSADARLLAEVHWYGDTKGPSSSTLAEPVAVANGWGGFTLEATPPPGTVAAQVFLRLLPPQDGGERYVAVDDVRLVQWAPDGTAPTPVHGAVRALGGPATERFVARLPPGGALLPGWIAGDPLLDP